jgi:hypothetical protein
MVGKSFPKILWRISNKKYSKHFIDALNGAGTVKYHPTDAITNLSHMDHGILDVVGAIADLRKIELPNLKAMAENRAGAQLYAAHTCQEFHLLLCTLLGAFQESFEMLSKWNTTRETLELYLSNAIYFMEVLWMMVNSSGINVHLQAISGDLQAISGDLQAISGDLRAKSEDEDIVVEKGTEEGEEDMDLHDVQPDTVMIDGSTQKLLPTWEACRDWLRVLVVHYDALKILCEDIESYEKPITINIKVIAVPGMEEGSKMLTWQALLEKYYVDTKPSLADIISTVEALQTDEVPTEDSSNLPKRILSKIFKTQLGEASPLSRGCGFTGINHCETCLASLMSKLGPVPSESQDDYNRILEELLVSHIVISILTSF